MHIFSERADISVNNQNLRITLNIYETRRSTPIDALDEQVRQLYVAESAWLSSEPETRRRVRNCPQNTGQRMSRWSKHDGHRPRVAASRVVDSQSASLVSS